MSHEKPTHHNSEIRGLTAIEEQKFKLLNLQTTQTHVLEKTGIASKAREVLIWKHKNMTELLRASDIEADLPPAPKVGDDGDVTRVVAAISHRKRNEMTIECPSVMFITTEQGRTDLYETYQSVPVGEIHRDGVLPLDGFSAEDVAAVDRLLDEVRATQAQGLLPDLRPSLATIRELSDARMSMSEVPNTAP